VLRLIEAIATGLARKGWVLRTGLSPGADQAFHRGACAGGGRVELYLPWSRFQAHARLQGTAGQVRVLPAASPAAHELAARFHPGWEGLAADARDLLARDGHEVLGAELCSPVRFVVCWSAEGSLDGAGLYTEGTGQALRIAHHHAIPVFNLGRSDVHL